MLYNSREYLLFLAITWAVYICLNHKAQNLWLLSASYFFFGYWDWRFLSLFLISTLASFFCAIKIYQSPFETKRRFWLVLNVVVNLGILGFFKYFNFFADSASSLLNTIGLPASFHDFSIILPIGISFYTFQSMGYVIDVYRKQLVPTTRITDFCLFVNFFATAVCGPIDRGKSLMPEISHKRLVTTEGIETGLFLIFLGLFKKIAVADAIGTVVEACFQNPALHTWDELITAVYLFSFQIYCDFSAYSDIARGSGKLFGFDIMQNFRQPYLSTNISEFWKRWHISLSSWLRDYLYIPLGGNQNGRFETFRNIMIVMLLGGLWHGAKWTFVIWGGLHGIYIAAYHLTRDRLNPLAQKVFRNETLLKFFKVFLVFNLVSFSWIFFRCDNLATAMEFIVKLLTGYSGMRLSLINYATVFGVSLLKITFLIWCVVLFDSFQYLKNEETASFNWPLPVRAGVYAYMILALLFFLPNHNVPFIYFQF